MPGTMSTGNDAQATETPGPTDPPRVLNDGLEDTEAMKRIQEAEAGEKSPSTGQHSDDESGDDKSGDESDTFHDAEDTKADEGPSKRTSVKEDGPAKELNANEEQTTVGDSPNSPASPVCFFGEIPGLGKAAKDTISEPPSSKCVKDGAEIETSEKPPAPDVKEGSKSPVATMVQDSSPIRRRKKRDKAPAVSEWSHQSLAPRNVESDDEEEEETWQAMPALGEYDIYDDDGRLIARGDKTMDEGAYAGMGGAGRGYTRVQLEEDAQSATSMDEDTKYLFKNGQQKKDEYEEDEQRDALTQLQATKDLLTEGQRIAYVGVTRLTIYSMVKELGKIDRTKGAKKELNNAMESMEKWGQQMMVRLYSHMEIDAAEQIMIEQLAEHGVQPTDLVPPLMQNSRVNNPMADEKSTKDDDKPADRPSAEKCEEAAPPPYEEVNVPLTAMQDNEEVPELQSPQDMPTTQKIDLDLRWTVLCDLFLVLISDSVYDSRSRRLLEQVADAMKISWLQICRFEKRVMDSLEMQEEASRENWTVEEHLENRRKMGLKRKYVMMGLATVGGGLVIGLSAGLLAPVIGAGLAAGFTTIGVTGTAGFLGGVGGAALITSAATAAGGTIAVRASNRRTGHVKTFEYRPLHNNKRLNLILTVSGWMNGKVDDVRLPYSTVDPIMGDIYSLLWEPEMLQSMGETINILATEALTQTVQQVLASTILMGLMASLQLPIVLTKLSYLIDNPWTVSLDRANSAGLILADSLIDRHLGQRPITLIGFSLGSRLIFACLRELASRGAFGLIQNVYLFGSPIVAKKEEYLRARSVISGRFVNGYASNDWILGYLFRATSGGIMRIAGLAPVEEIPGLENIDVTGIVNGHMAYRASMPKLLREVKWEVESDEFTEIEDPDPDNHQKRQRELIQEIDQVRKQADEKPTKKRFGLFRRNKPAEKRGWETYDTRSQGAHSRKNSDGLASPGLESNVLFDIDAIRRELESEMIEVRELGSTLPPMQITTLANGEKRMQPLPFPPSDLHPDEIAAMKLPPRPSEIDGHETPPLVANVVRPVRSRSRTPEPEMGFEMPRELKTTLPPLTLSPSLPQENLKPLSRPPSTRPDLKSHASTPPLASWGRSQTPSSWDRSPQTQPRSPVDLASPVEAMNLEHNAWADDGEDEHGRESRVKMTFE